MPGLDLHLLLSIDPDTTTNQKYEKQHVLDRFSLKYYLPEQPREI